MRVYSNYSITNDLVDPFLGEINIWSSINDTEEGSFLQTKVCRAQVHDASKESKGESIDFHEKCIAEEILEESRKGVEKEHFARCSRYLITVITIMVQKGESACVEVSK